MSENKMGIGQHRVGAVGGGNTGQRSGREPAANVGQPSGGELNNGPAPAAAPDSFINTTHGAEEAPFYSRNVRRK
jgi:hypothetical protein